MMRKLVIGCGYLGRRVAAMWSEGGHEVFALTRSVERAEEFDRVGWQPIVGDVMDPSSLEHLPEADVVLYAMGFDRAAGYSQREVYVEGLRNVLGALAGRAKKWIFISSTSIYGQDQGEVIDETCPAEPKTPNGQVCREAEKLFEQHFPRGEGQILRLAGIYGPGRLLRRLSDLKAGKPIAGDPEGWLNLIHVEDAAETVQACEERGRPGAIYLVSDNRPIRRREYYSLLARLAGVDAPVFDAETSPRFAGGLGKRCFNRKIREELGVELKYPTIEEGLPGAVASDLTDD